MAEADKDKAREAVVHAKAPPKIVFNDDVDASPNEKIARYVGNFASVMNRRYISKHKKFKDGWQQINPLQLLTRLIEALVDAQLNNTSEKWADVANYCMFLAAMSSASKERLSLGPKIIALMVNSSQVKAVLPSLEALAVAPKDKASVPKTVKLDEQPAFLANVSAIAANLKAALAMFDHQADEAKK